MKLRAAVSAVCLLLLAGVVPAGEEELPTRVFDVSSLLGSRVDPAFESLGLGVETLYAPEEEDPVSSFTSEELVKLLRRFVSPREWSMGDVSLDWIGENRLSVTAPAGMLDRAAALLDDLFTVSARRIEVRADLVTFDAAGVDRLAASGSLGALERGRLDRPALAAVLAVADRPGSHREQGASMLRPGRLGRIAKTEAVSYVADMDVEIAMGSGVADPIVRHVTDGWLLYVRPFLLMDGSVYLEAVQQRAELARPIRRLNPEAAPLGTIDLPAVSMDRTFTAARVAAGETLAILRRDGSGPRSLVALLLTPAVTGAAPRERIVAELPCRLLTTGGRSARAGWPAEDDADYLEQYAPTSAGLTTAPAMHVEPAVEAIYAEDFAALVGKGAVPTAGGAWFPSPESIAPIRERLGAIERDVTRSYRVHLALSRDEKPLGSLDTEVLSGRSAFWEKGIERTYLADWEVEVAEEARIGDPQIGRAFGGVLANLRFDRAPGDDRIVGRVTLAVVDLDPVIEVRRPGAEHTGVIEIPRTVETFVERELLLEPGKPVSFREDGLGVTISVEPQ